MAVDAFSGILAPALTPFKPSLNPDAEAFLQHCQWLLEQGIDGLAVFGTTSEANSLGMDERMHLLERLIDGGILPEKLMPGTGTCAITDTVRLTQHAVERGCRGVLMLPPFYYKGVSDEGLFASYAEVIERVGDSALRIYLYHIPPVSQVGLSLELIGRLLRAYPDVIAGIKDSGGDWNNTRAVLREYPTLATFCGSEVFLLETLRHGGAGSITATANINPAQICELYRRWQDDDADELQVDVTAVRAAYANYATVPALKAVAAKFYGSPDWRGVRPPLCALESDAARELSNALEAAGLALQPAGL